MCLIIYKKLDKHFPEDLFRTAIFLNPDGFGIFWAEDGRVRGKKGLLTQETIVRYWRENQHREFVCHLRFGTSGDITKENTHPFRVLDLEEDGVDLLVCHNGTLGNVPIQTKGLSDSYHFVEHYLKPLLKKNPNQLYDPDFQKFLGLTISGSRMVFMAGDGKVTIINESLGKKKAGCWISNEYSIVKPISKAHAGDRYNIIVKPPADNEQQLKLL